MALFQLCSVAAVLSLFLATGICGRCGIGYWQCEDGQCIPRRWRCDGTGDCLDGSDEMDCSCPQEDFECTDASMCVTKEAVCDGLPQCTDGSDELYCNQSSGCLPGDWACRNRICIPQELRCNGEDDCGDGSDEEGCGPCGEQNVRCPNGTCLALKERCDGVAQCSDGSDEPVTCGKTCVLKNGGCSHSCTDQLWGALCSCPSGMKLSSNGAKCVDINECAQPFGPCMHTCINKKGSFQCRCNPGFKLQDNVCQGNATKLLTTKKGLIGSVNVKAKTLETLFSVDRDPVAMAFDLAHNVFYWADGNGNIYMAEDQKSTVLYSGHGGIKSLAFEWLHGQLYWANSKLKGIYTGAPDGSAYSKVTSKDTDPTDLVLLPMKSSMFWINRGPNDEMTVEKAGMDGSMRTTLVVVTAQSARSLTLDVAAQRLYWISDFKMSIETIRVDGTGRYTFREFFRGRRAQNLAVFNGWFYWADEKRLWQAPQNQPDQKSFVLKAALPILTAYHEQQQPQAPCPCRKAHCQLCLPSLGMPSGFMCSCPKDQLPVAEGSCQSFRLAYASSTNIYTLEYTAEGPVKSLLFSASEEVEAFDVDWKRGWVVWTNLTGQLKVGLLEEGRSEYIPTLKPACAIRVDQKTGNVYWVSCDALSIGATHIILPDHSVSKLLHQARGEIMDLFVDWQRGQLYWLEDGQIINMKLSLMGGNAKSIYSFEKKSVSQLVLDRKANSFLWSTKNELQVLSLLKKRAYSAGKEWTIPNKIVAAYEPYMVTMIDDVVTPWRRQDGMRLQSVALGRGVLGVIVALRELKEDDAPSHSHGPCRSPSILCKGTSVCISQTQLCDGKKDCPDGSDEASCGGVCPKQGDFQCKDKTKCIGSYLVCDGYLDCADSSDEVGCPTVSAPTNTAAPLRCRFGSKLCADGSECVLFSHVCDGEVDCKDGSDEEGCERQCKAHQFHCAHGRMCIDKKLVCDGTPQCQDRSDEMGCFTTSEGCSHHCDDRTRCIPESFLCDGERDCADGTDEAGCPPATKGPSYKASTEVNCKYPSVKCEGTSLCISQSQLCDGKLDCPDESDERFCMQACSDPGQFLCKNKRRCIEKMFVCDGHADCTDGSDELQCPPCPRRCDDRSMCLTDQQFCDGKVDCSDGSDERNCVSSGGRAAGASTLKCRVGFKACLDGSECILYSHVCDGEKDCKDGSDEKDCEQQCKKGRFQCAHGRMCIDMKQVCDGTPQCQDRSDEMNCYERSEDCHHYCDNRTRCLPETFICDGERDCFDGTDEVGCAPEPCSTGNFQCASGQCVSTKLRCDGHADCKDHSDEKSCRRPPHCPLGERCPRSHECLLKEWRCDGHKDCTDGSDEKNCKTRSLQCGQFQWSCASKTQCIPTSWRCDGTKDCKDQSDEAGCAKVECPSHLFQCRSEGCVNPRLVCNGVSDCVDGSDEGLGCLSSNCSRSQMQPCEHYCANTPQGARCGCRAGFRLQANGVSCVDIDECMEIQPSVCSHKCHNTHGSYACQCSPGFLLEPDGSTCKSPEEPHLLAAVQNELLFKDLRRGNLQLLLPPGQTPIFSMDYDLKEQKLYWVSLEEKTIKYAVHGDKDNIKALIKGVKSDSIAVDWIGRNLYWVDGAAKQILAVRLSNSVVKPRNYMVILDEDLEQPRSLVLLPQKGLMLWSDIGVTESRIERAGMDGSQRKVVINRNLRWPVSLAVDIVTDRIYWTDEKLQCIGSATLDGEDIRFLQLTETSAPFSVAVFNDMVYWSDNQRRTIYGAHKTTGKNRTVILKRPGQPFGLKVVHPLMQPKTPNPCQALKCSHMCLLTSGSQAVCRCPAGLLLAEDRLTCSSPGESASASAFLLLLSPSVLTQIFTKNLHVKVELNQWPQHQAMALPGISEATGLDLVLRDHMLYLADAKQASVAQLQMDDYGITRKGSPLQLSDDTVTALAVDWITHNLYWSSLKKPQLYVSSPGWKYTAVLVKDKLQDTTSIALHPPTGRLCFTAVELGGTESLPLVSCAFMNGESRMVLWKKAQMPMSLTFSTQGSRLYWADIAAEVLASVDIDGSNYREYKTGPPLIVSFAPSDNILFWVTLYNGTNTVWYSDGVQPKQMWFEVQTNIVALKAYSANSQKGSNLCAENNGGCSQLCLAKPGGRTCRCAQGYLVVSKTQCEPTLECPAGSKACKNGYECLTNTKFCDHISDCPDGSDEEDCAYLNGNQDFKHRAPPPPSSSGSQSVARPQDDALLQTLGGQSCDAELCNGRGQCVMQKGEQSCKCVQGYSGTFCEVGGSSSTSVVLSVLFILATVVIAAVLLRMRREKALRGRSIDKETLMKDLEDYEEPEEQESPPQNFVNELYDPDKEEEATESVN